MSRCVRCLAETPPEAFFENDYLCDICAALREEFPLASTPEERPLVSTTDAQVAAYGRAGEFRRTLVKMQNGLFRGAWDKDAGGVPEPDEGGE